MRYNVAREQEELRTRGRTEVEEKEE